MKCVVLNGSPRKGNTFELAEIVMGRMRGQGTVEFEEIHLSGLDIPFCRGCMRCFERGEDACPHHASIAPIAQAIQAADGLIVLTPAYSLAPTALLKNVIDHMSYCFHRPCFFGKKALVLATTAGAGAKQSARYIRNVLKHWGFNRVHTFAIACHAVCGYRPPPKVEDRLHRLAGRFFAEVAGGRLHRPSLKRVLYYNAWRAMAAVNPDSCDGQYWQAHNLAGRTFAPQIRQGPPARLFGRLIFSAFKAMAERFS